jgi:ppGpp synthetase/RelA/SpoT-type nucleotidyltranferase
VDHLSPQLLRNADHFMRVAVNELRLLLAGQDSFYIDHPCTVAGRVKSLESLETKIKQSHEGAPTQNFVNDFLGIRVLVAHVGSLHSCEALITTWAAHMGLAGICREDHFESPAPAGYRAIHIDYRLPDSPQWQFPESLGLELQLTTWLQNLHGILSHRMYYKQGSLPTRTTVQKWLNDLSLKISEIDSQIAEWCRDFPPDGE